MKATDKKQDYKQIDSFEAACQATGRPGVPDLSGFPEDMREWIGALYRAAVETEAVNGGGRPDWADNKQSKYFPWFYHEPKSPSGFAFYATRGAYSLAYAGLASRFCTLDSERARHLGETFLADHDAILRK